MSDEEKTELERLMEALREEAAERRRLFQSLEQADYQASYSPGWIRETIEYLRARNGQPIPQMAISNGEARYRRA